MDSFRASFKAKGSFKILPHFQQQPVPPSSSVEDEDDDDPEDLKEGRRLRREREKQLFEQGMRAGSNVRGGVKWGPVMLRAPTNEADVSVASKSSRILHSKIDPHQRYIDYRRRMREAPAGKKKLDNASFFLLFSVVGEWRRAIIHSRIVANRQNAEAIAERVGEDALAQLDIRLYTLLVVFETWKDFRRRRMKLREKRLAATDHTAGCP